MTMTDIRRRLSLEQGHHDARCVPRHRQRAAARRAPYSRKRCRFSATPRGLLGGFQYGFLSCLRDLDGNEPSRWVEVTLATLVNCVFRAIVITDSEDPDQRFRRS